jgi:hypothetical protein
VKLVHDYGDARHITYVAAGGVDCVPMRTVFGRGDEALARAHTSTTGFARVPALQYFGARGGADTRFVAGLLTPVIALKHFVTRRDAQFDVMRKRMATAQLRFFEINDDNTSKGARW